MKTIISIFLGALLILGLSYVPSTTLAQSDEADETTVLDPEEDQESTIVDPEAEDELGGTTSGHSEEEVVDPAEVDPDIAGEESMTDEPTESPADGLSDELEGHPAESE